MPLNLADFHVSETHAFVVEEPLAKLPDYFETWNELAGKMPQAVAASTMRQEVEQMPLLDWMQLTGHRQKRLAHLQLTIIASGYVWQNGDKGASKKLPACVAVPLYQLSDDLGLPPVICHPGLALANYAVIDSSKPLMLGNMKALYYLPGGKESEWFCIVTTMVELTFAKVLKPILAILDEVKRGDEESLKVHLKSIAQVVKEMQSVLSQMHEKLTGGTFFNALRPFLGGWGGESNPLPDGLIYEGISDQPIHAVGGSAAQSSTMQVLDALLGVRHAPDKNTFLLKMRSYMPPSHRKFIIAVENHSPSLHEIVEKSTNDELHKVFNTVLSAVVDFRSYHIQIVTKYIIQASIKVKQTEDKRFECLDKKGTGGTSILPFLKELKEDTKDNMVDSKPTAFGDGHL